MASLTCIAPDYLIHMLISHHTRDHVVADVIHCATGTRYCMMSWQAATWGVLIIAAAAAALPCSEEHNACFHNPDHVVDSMVVTEAGDCCNACSADYRCQSFTVWEEDGTLHMHHVMHSMATLYVTWCFTWRVTCGGCDDMNVRRGFGDCDLECLFTFLVMIQGALQCNIFSTSEGSRDGNCTSGTVTQRPPRPNFIFYFPDTLRAESFGIYGNPLNVTPNVDKV